jgi:Secretion system C-terminal sorting domain
VEYSRIIVFQPKLVAEKNLTVINNPAHDRLNISFESAIDQNIDIKVYDLLGKIRMVQPMNLYQGSNLLNLSLPSSLTTGLYIVEVANKIERYSAKFIKQ